MHMIHIRDWFKIPECFPFTVAFQMKIDSHLFISRFRSLTLNNLNSYYGMQRRFDLQWEKIFRQRMDSVITQHYK